MPVAQLSPPLSPAPFPSSAQPVAPSEGLRIPTNNIKPYGLRPAGPPRIASPIPGYVPAAAAGASAAEIGALVAIPLVVIGGVVGGIADPLSVGDIPKGARPGEPGYNPALPGPPPGAPKKPGGKPKPDGGEIGAKYRAKYRLVRKGASPVDIPQELIIKGRYSDLITIPGPANTEIGVNQAIGGGQATGFYAFATISTIELSLWSIEGLSFTKIQNAPAPAPLAPPEAPPAQPYTPRPPKPNYFPNPDDPGRIVPFTRPGRKSPEPETPPKTPGTEPKPHNVPKPFRRPGPSPQRRPDRRFPAPGTPQTDPPLPKTPPGEPAPKSPDAPTQPEPKVPYIPGPAPQKAPGPQKTPQPNYEPQPSPQTDPPTIPNSDPAPIPQRDPFRDPPPQKDPYKEDTPNPNPRPLPFPIPIPGPPQAPQKDPNPQRDPAPSPNPNPRPQKDPIPDPQTDPNPKRDPNKSPNPNPPYFPPPPTRPPNCPPCPPQVKPPDSGDKCPDPCKDVPQVSITYRKFVGCRSLLGVPNYFVNSQVTVSQPDAAAITLALNNQADLLALQCNVSDAIAAVPDWWQVRLGADRPQLLIQYAQQFTDGTWDKPKYIVSIPYWNKSKDATVITDFPSYQKGQYQGCLILSDNSKLIINAKNATIASSVIGAISLGIDPLKLIGSEYTTSERRGNRLAEIVVFPRIAKFFATGQKDLNPTWSKKFY